MEARSLGPNLARGQDWVACGRPIEMRGGDRSRTHQSVHTRPSRPGSSPCQWARGPNRSEERQVELSSAPGYTYTEPANIETDGGWNVSFTFELLHLEHDRNSNDDISGNWGEFWDVFTSVLSNRSNINVMALLLMPMKRLMQDRETYAVLGTLNTYDIGYIIGVTDQLFHKKKIDKHILEIFIQVRFIENAFLSSEKIATSFFECMNNSDSVKICFLIRNKKTFIFRIWIHTRRLTELRRA